MKLQVLPPAPPLALPTTTPDRLPRRLARGRRSWLWWLGLAIASAALAIYQSAFLLLILVAMLSALFALGLINLGC